MRFLIILFMGLATVFCGGDAQAYGYQYMKEHRKLDNQRAAKIYLTEGSEGPYPYRTMKWIQIQTNQKAHCEKKLRRVALRARADGILNFKSAHPSGGNQWFCEGELVQWIKKEDPG